MREAKAKAKNADGKLLSDCAELHMLGRYKRYYVDPPYGRPILSGRQLLQLRPVNLRRISDRSFRHPETFIVHQGWSLFTCDGRSEEALGSPAFVSSLWEGWMASNHIMRASPKSQVPPGYLYAALRSPYAQLQMKACATGSVVDALDPDTVGKVLIPMLPEKERRDLGIIVEQAWEDIAKSVRLTSETVGRLDSLILDAYENRSTPA